MIYWNEFKAKCVEKYPLWEMWLGVCAPKFFDEDEVVLMFLPEHEIFALSLKKHEDTMSDIFSAISRHPVKVSVHILADGMLLPPFPEKNHDYHEDLMCCTEEIESFLIDRNVFARYDMRVVICALWHLSLKGKFDLKNASKEDGLFFEESDEFGEFYQKAMTWIENES